MTAHNPRHPTFILASSSPRRIELLRQSGLGPQIAKPKVSEKKLPGESPLQMVRRLAFEKAKILIPQLLKNNENIVILAADTIVVAPNKTTVFGKPKDPQDALKMLRTICGKTHTVYTGYCLLQAQKHSKQTITKKIIRAIRSEVTMRKMNTDSLLRYIDTGEPMDKAGAYAAQGIGMGLITNIRGSYTNVVGLPLSEVLEDLEKHFKISGNL